MILKSTSGFSLAKYANYSLVAVLIALVLATSAGLWVMHEQSRRHDAALAELLAQKNAQLLSEQLAFDQATISERALQATLEHIVAPDERAVVLDSLGRVVAQVGTIAGNNGSARAVADITGSSWQLEVSRTASSHLVGLLFKGATIWITSLVAIALVILTFRVLKTTASELKHIRTFLRQVGSGPFVVDPPPCELKETAALLPAVQRIAAISIKNSKPSPS